MFTCSSKRILAAGTLALAWTMPAPAALIAVNDAAFAASADGFNITRDSSTGLDWLDLDLSIGRTIDDPPWFCSKPTGWCGRRQRPPSQNR